MEKNNKKKQQEEDKISKEKQEKANETIKRYIEVKKKLQTLKKDNIDEKNRHVKLLFRKYKKFLKVKYELRQFNSPVVWLIRGSGKIDFYDNATSGNFKFQHTDGHIRRIELTSPALTGEYGSDNFKLYILHEDYPFPLTDNFNPILSLEQLKLVLDKYNRDYNKWQYKEDEVKSKRINNIIKMIALLLAVFVGGYLALTLLAPDIAKMLITRPEQAQQVIQVVNTTIDPTNVPTSILGK